MLWYAARVGADRRAVVRACCEIVRSVLHLVPAGEERPRLAIEAAERWADEPTAANQDAAWCEAWGAASAASGAASDAARDAARAAASGAASGAAWGAASAASGAASAAARDAAWDAAWDASLSRSADVVRRHFPEVPNG